MSSFGDFTLVRAVPSYGGAEVVRARRSRGGLTAPAIHLALYGSAPVQERLVAAAEAAAQGHPERVARILEVGRCAGSLYAVGDALEGLDLRSLLEHERARRAAPDVELALAVALSLAQLATELMERDVWAGARGAGISSLFAAGLRLDAVVLTEQGVSLRPLAGAADDPARPGPFCAPEMGVRFAAASGVTDVFAITQVLRALCANDPEARSAPRLQPATLGVAPILAAGLAPAVDERMPLPILVEQLRALLQESSGELRAAAVIRRALAGPLASLVPESPPDPAPPPQAGPVGPRPVSIAWPLEPDDQPITDQNIPAFARVSRSSDHEAVARVFTEEGEATAVRLEIGPAAELADEPTQKMPARPSQASAPRRTTSDPPWVSSGDVKPLSESGSGSGSGSVSDSGESRAAAAPVAIASEIEGGPTVELHAADADKTEV